MGKRLTGYPPLMHKTDKICLLHSYHEKIPDSVIKGMEEGRFVKSQKMGKNKK